MRVAQPALATLMQCDEVLTRLKRLANPEAVEGMARFGINPHDTLGVSMPNVRKIAKEVGKDHALAEELWRSGVHEARIVACLVDDPKSVSEDQLDRWVGDFDSWDVCDQCCSNLFDKTEFAYDRAVHWANRDEEFVRRAGFVMMAALSVHDKKASDSRFLVFLPIIKSRSTDERNFVKKAVNWALRQIGKRNQNLNEAAIKTATEIKTIDSKGARWIASDALRELTSKPVQQKLMKKRKTGD
jgi:3-methyladenine DNA glycosylase AlkD